MCGHTLIECSKLELGEEAEMTILYFVRHAEPNYLNHDDGNRELSAKGLKDRELVSQYLSNKKVDAVLSSPYKRAIDTIQPFADSNQLPIEIVEDFRERKVDSAWIEDFTAFSKKQWSDFSYKLADGETLEEVQMRNVNALMRVLGKYQDKTVVIGSHGTALCTIIHYFDNSFGYEDFAEIKSLMPWIVKFIFCGRELQNIEKINVFERED